MRKIIHVQTRDREHAQILERRGLLAPQRRFERHVEPRDERGEAAGLVLQFPQHVHVFDAFFVGFDRTVHHRRGRGKSDVVRLTHHIEPLVRRDFARRDALAHALDENLGAGAGERFQTSRLEAFQHRARR